MVVGCEGHQKYLLTYSNHTMLSMRLSRAMLKFDPIAMHMLREGMQPAIRRRAAFNLLRNDMPHTQGWQCYLLPTSPLFPSLKEMERSLM